MRKIIIGAVVGLLLFMGGYNLGVHTGNRQVLEEQIIEKNGGYYTSTWNGNIYKYR